MEKSNITSDISTVLEKHQSYVMRKYRKNILRNIIFVITVALYTSLWWTGIVLKNNVILVFNIGVTVLTVIICTIAVLADDPVWNTDSILSEGKDCCNKEAGKCNCEEK